MMEHLRERLQPVPEHAAEVVLQQADIRDVDVQNASLVVLNLTLQFRPPEARDAFAAGIAAGTIAGGALVLSEKICSTDPAQQQLMTTLHHDLKRAHGYSHLEIAQKRTAIENRLIPETLEVHVARLQTAGFTIVSPWFQCFNFASILAVK